MHNAAAAGLAALTLAVLSGAASAQPAAPPGPPPAPAQGASPGLSPASPMAEVMKRRAELLTRCPAAPQASEAETAGLPIHVTRWGGDGPRVLVVHGGVQGGLGGGPTTFARQEALAGRGWRLDVVDRPGFGASPTRGPDDMERDAGWIADMLGDGAHLLAHSWGAAESLLAAARRPGAVRSLILVEPALEAMLPGAPEAQDPAVQAALAERLHLLLTAQTPEEYGIGFARSLGAAPGTPGGGTSPNAAAAAFEADPQRAAAVGCALLRARMAPPDAMRAAAAAVKAAGIPTLVISGGWSPSYNAVGEMTARLTGGRHVIVPSGSHFVQLANAEEFNEVVDAFMRGAERAGRQQAPLPGR